MKFTNAIIKKIDISENGSVCIFAEALLEDKDFKSTKKINWLSIDSPLVIFFQKKIYF